MKKLYTLLLSLLSVSAFAQQQLPNNDFEKWTAFMPCTGIDSLVNYSTNDQNIYYSNEPYFCVTSAGATKSTTAQSGNFALSLKPTKVLGNLTVGSSITLQDRQRPNQTDIKGIPFTGMPSKLTGYYRFNSGNKADSLKLFVYFTRGGEYIGYGEFTAGETVNTYTKFEADIEYFLENAADKPDSLVFILKLGDNDANINANTSALVDNLIFEYNSTNLDPDQLLRTGVTVIQKDGLIQFSEKVANVRISDIIGNTVFETTSDLLEVNINTLSRGVYILTYYYNNQPTSQKIVLN